MIMDMQMGVFCGVFSIIASLVVYAILSFYSIKEDSFDEAKANRRKLFKEYFDQRSGSDKNKPKKTNKKAAKKLNKKPEPVIESVDKKDTVDVPEVPKEPQPPAAKDLQNINKKQDVSAKNGPKGKPQSVEKNESTSTTTNVVASNENPGKKSEKKMKGKGQAQGQAQTQAQGQAQTQAQSQALNQAQGQAQSQAQGQSKKLDVEVTQNPLPIIPKEPEKKTKSEIKVEKKKTENVNNNNIQNNNNNASLRKQPSGPDKQGVNVNSILSLIKKADISKSEVQLLIDTLLNSQDESSEWLKVKKIDSGRQDNCVKLRKQLTDLEETLKNEKQITLSLQGKLKDLRSEMASDKAVVGTLKENLKKIQQEKDELLYEKGDMSLKLKALNDEKMELQEQLNKELDKAQQQQKIDDDQHHETVITLKDEISGVTAQLEAFENENASLKSTITRLEQDLTMHQNCQEKITGLERALNVLSDKLNEKDGEISISRKQLDSLSSTVNKFKKENNDLKMDNEGLSNKMSTSSKEVERLREEVAILSDKLTDFENGDNSKENGDDIMIDSAKTAQLLEEKENRLIQLTNVLDNNMKNLDDLKQQLLNSNHKNDNLKSMLDQTNSELKDLKESIAKLKAHKSESEKLIANLKNNMNDTNCENALLKEEIEKYKQHNHVINESTKKSTKEDLSDGPNGIDSKYDSLKLLLKEKENNLKEMTCQIDSHVKNLAELKKQLLNTTQENDKLKKLLENGNAELFELKEQISKLKTYHSENEKVIASLQTNVKECNVEIHSLKEEIEKYKHRNNELRSKNWKVIQALAEAESAVLAKMKSEGNANGSNPKTIEEIKSNVNIFVKRLFPDLDIEENKGHFNEWLRSVEDAVSSKKADNSSQELRSQNTHLQSLVVNYKKIISDTEQMLNELQTHIEVEESKWKEKFNSYQLEIDTLRALQKTFSS